MFRSASKKLAAAVFCLLSVLMIGRADPAYALTTSNGLWEYTTTTVDSQEVVVIKSYKGSQTSVSVPSAIGGLPVRRIDGAFQSKPIESVTLPAGNYDLVSTFSDCRKLKSVTINGTVSVMLDSFNGCTSLQTVLFKKGAKAGEFISTFYGCSGLKQVMLPEGTTLLDDTFYGCTSLTAVRIPRSLKTMGLNAADVFHGCTQLKDVTYAGSKCEWIGLTSKYFEKCTSQDTLKKAAVHYVVSTSQHQYTGSWEVLEAPTCTANGTEAIRCDRCGELKKRTVASLGHSFGAWGIVKYPTCIESGLEARYCVRQGCGHNESRIVPANGHSFGEWEEEQAATATEEGIMVRVCKECGFTENEIIPPTGTGTESGTGTENDSGTAAPADTDKGSEAAADSSGGTGTEKAEEVLPTQGMTLTVELKGGKIYYNGRKQKPKVKAVYYNGKKLKKKYYKVKYRQNKNVGLGLVLVQGKGKYSGCTGVTEFRIRLKKPTISKIKSTKAGRFKVTWKKDKQAQYFEVQYGPGKNLNTVGTIIRVEGKHSAVITELISKQKYYVRVRSFRYVNGELWHSKWSKKKKIKVK